LTADSGDDDRRRQGPRGQEARGGVDEPQGRFGWAWGGRKRLVGGDQGTAAEMFVNNEVPVGKRRD